MMTRAALLRDQQSPFSLESVQLDEPRDDEVLVRLLGVGMCHSDLIVRSRARGLDTPTVLGHEGAGIVEAVGSAVHDLAPGDTVVMTFESCGACDHCRSGAPSYCDHFFEVNSSGRRLDGSTGARDADGHDVDARWFGQSSFADHALGTRRNVVKIRSDVPLELMGPLGCGIQTGAGSVINSLRVRAGDTLAVFGAGAVGLAAVMAARLAGATTIIAVDLHRSRRDLALELGATHALDGADPEVAQQVRDISRGGVRYALDTTGSSAAILSAITALRFKGFCGLVAGVPALSLPVGTLRDGKGLGFLLEGDAVPHVFIPQLIELWTQGRFPFDRLVTTYPLDEIGRAEADSASGAVVKPVLLPGRPS